jgi:hypothetical protein
LDQEQLLVDVFVLIGLLGLLELNPMMIRARSTKQYSQQTDISLRPCSGFSAGLTRLFHVNHDADAVGVSFICSFAIASNRSRFKYPGL